MKSTFLRICDSAPRCLVILLVAAALPFAIAQAQARTLQAVVATTSVSMVGDTTTITLQVTNRAQSTDSIFGIYVEAPAGVLRISKPTIGGTWTTGTQFITMSAAIWHSLGFRIAPGVTTPPLTLAAVGIPGIVRIWATPGVAGPDSLMDETTSPTPPPAPSQQLDSAALSLQTIGVVPITSRDPVALGQRLSDLIGEACDLGWIDNRGICNSLQVKARGNKSQLSALEHELSAQRGKHVSESAYQLLSANVSFLQSLSP
jgi:hypothetical protein